MVLPAAMDDMQINHGSRSDKDVAWESVFVVCRGKSDQCDAQWNCGADFRSWGVGSRLSGQCRIGLPQGTDFLPMRSNHVRCCVQGIAFGGGLLPSPPGRDSSDAAGRLRQAETHGTTGPGSAGALFGRGVAPLCEGDGIAGPAVAAGLSCASSG